MSDLPSIATLFAAEGGTASQPLDFHWRLIRRNGRPFLLLPKSAGAARIGLDLYSPHRPVAKIAHKLLGSSLGFPLLSLFERVSFPADEAAELMRFIRSQSDIPFSKLHAPAILFSYRALDRHRFVILLCDQIRRTGRVIKVGMRPNSHLLIEREADQIERLPHGLAGAVELTGRVSTPAFSAFATPYCFGENPTSDAGIEAILGAWLQGGTRSTVGSFSLWQELARACSEEPDFRPVDQAVATHGIQSAIHHGDFAPWNVRVDADGNWKVFDWERCELNGIPGWDWFHFTVQHSLLVKRHSPERAATRVEQLLASERFQAYASAAGISTVSKPLLLAYLLRQKYIIKPEDGAPATSALHELLARRWEFTQGLSARPAKAAPSRSRESFQPARELAGASNQNVPSLLNRMSSSWLKTYQQMAMFLFTHRQASNRTSLLDNIVKHWGTILCSWALLVGAALLHHLSDPHMVFIPFYLIPCAMLTLRLNRRWGYVAGLASAFAGPLVQKLGDPDYAPLGVMLWNSAMRFVLYLTFIVLLDSIHRDVASRVQKPAMP